MRVRTLFTFATGAAVGAGALYLLDPDHGAQRRAHARRRALEQARSGATRAVVDARRRAAEAALTAAAGYRQARDAPPGG